MTAFVSKAEFLCPNNDGFFYNLFWGLEGDPGDKCFSNTRGFFGLRRAELFRMNAPSSPGYELVTRLMPAFERHAEPTS